MTKQKVLQHLLWFRTWPAALLYLKSEKRPVLDKDLARYLPEIPYEKVGVGALDYTLLFVKPFRNILYYRTENSSFLRPFARLFLPPLPAIEIHGKIGEGFAVYHNASVIHPHTAGRNFTVNFGVVIGKGKPGSAGPEILDPVIGDDVTVYPNASIFGGITIGNRVQIGAGAVVNKDVPDDCTVVGNPMRILPHHQTGAKT